MSAQRIVWPLLRLLCLLSLFGGCQLQAPLAMTVTRPGLQPNLSPSLELTLTPGPGLSESTGFRVLSPRQPEEVHSLRFCLLEHDTGSSPAGGVDLVPRGQVFSYRLGQAPPLGLLFGNVRANGSGKSYSVAVAALNEAGENITSSTGDNAAQQRVTIQGETGNFYLSSGGGDPDFPGSVRVSPISYALSGTLSLSVALKLADG